MKTRAVVSLLLIATLASVASAQKKTASPRADSSSKTAAAKAAPTVRVTAPKRTSTPAAKPTPKTTPAVAEARSSKTQTNKSAKAELKSSSKASAKPPAEKRQVTKPAEVTATPKPPAQSAARKYRGDIYGLAGAVFQRWNFTEFFPSAEEFAALQVDAASRRMKRMAEAFDAFSNAAEQRQINVRKAAVATYLLGTARNARPVYASSASEFSAAQLAVVRATLRQDASTMANMMQLYDPLREAHNRAAENERVAAGKLAEGDAWRPSHQAQAADPGDRHKYAVTVALADVARDRTKAVLAARAPVPEMVEVLEQVEQIARTQEERSILSSFAPASPRPAPAYSPLVDPDTPIPQETGNPRNRPAPPREIKPPPDRSVIVPVEFGHGVVAAAAGTVAYAGEVRGYGNTIILEHEGQVFSLYSYLATYTVAEGDELAAGQQLGTAGTIPGTETGAVRFEVRRGRSAVDATELLSGRSPEQALLKR